MKALYDKSTNRLTKADETKIPCDPSCRDIWANGQEVEEGKDYEAKSICAYYKTGCSDKENCDDCRIVAVPLSPPVQEDEFDNFIELFRERIGIGQIDPLNLEWFKKRFKITKTITP